MRGVWSDGGDGGGDGRGRGMEAVWMILGGQDVHSAAR